MRGFSLNFLAALGGLCISFHAMRRLNAEVQKPEDRVALKAVIHILWIWVFVSVSWLLIWGSNGRVPPTFDVPLHASDSPRGLLLRILSDYNTVLVFCLAWCLSRRPPNPRIFTMIFVLVLCWGAGALVLWPQASRFQTLLVVHKWASFFGSVGAYFALGWMVWKRLLEIITREKSTAHPQRDWLTHSYQIITAICVLYGLAQIAAYHVLFDMGLSERLEEFSVILFRGLPAGKLALNVVPIACLISALHEAPPKWSPKAGLCRHVVRTLETIFIVSSVSAVLILAIGMG